MICPSCGAENLEGNDRCDNCLGSFRDLDIPSSDAAEGLARHVMEDRLSQLDQEVTVVVAPDTPAADVARKMKEANTGCALVLDGPKLVGIFTERDVLRSAGTTAASSFGSALQVEVKNLMSSNPEILNEDESIAFALNKMSIGQYRHIPIQRADGSFSVASIKSVLKYIAQEQW